jgi:hypothetical protein
MRKFTALVFGAFILVLLHSHLLRAQTTEFTYQGSLNTAGAPANGNHDFEFLLFDALSGGNQVGTAIALNNVAIANGVFSVKLNFGNQFISGATRFLEIRVRPSGQGGITILAPRQLINSSPYAIKSLGAFNAESATTATTALTANNALQLGGVPANQFIVTTDPRLSDARPPIPGSPSYIQNGTSPQASSNFNISNTGTANIFNALSQYSLGSFRILSNGGTTNLFVGVGAGNANLGASNAFVGHNAGFSNTAGSDNAFFGAIAGQGNTIGTANSFFGSFSGRDNTQGTFNSFFGSSAGLINTTGSENAFFGFFAGRLNTAGQNSFFGSRSGEANSTGESNSFFGKSAGDSNTVGRDNAFFGTFAGSANTTGNGNAFFGRNSGLESMTGSNNVFVGKNAGYGITVGSNNTFIGADTGTASSDLSFATAIGAGATVGGSNTIILGRIGGADSVRIPGILYIFDLGVGGSTALCRNSFLGSVSTCSSSARYKSNIASFGSGLDLIRRLAPVSFNWKDGGMRDVGLVAEEVAEIEPLLITTNDKGEIEGVKYDRVAVVLVNAVKEQQAEIEAQKKEISDLRSLVEALKTLVCASNREAEICKP